MSKNLIQYYDHPIFEGKYMGFDICIEQNKLSIRKNGKLNVESPLNQSVFKVFTQEIQNIPRIILICKKYIPYQYGSTIIYSYNNKNWSKNKYDDYLYHDDKTLYIWNGYTKDIMDIHGKHFTFIELLPSLYIGRQGIFLRGKLIELLQYNHMACYILHDNDNFYIYNDIYRTCKIINNEGNPDIYTYGSESNCISIDNKEYNTYEKWIHINKITQTVSNHLLLINCDSSLNCIFIGNNKYYLSNFISSYERKELNYPIFWDRELLFIRSDKQYNIFGTFDMKKIKYFGKKNYSMLIFLIWLFQQTLPSKKKISAYIPKYLFIHFIFPLIYI